MKFNVNFIGKKCEVSSDLWKIVCDFKLSECRWLH